MREWWQGGLCPFFFFSLSSINNKLASGRQFGMKNSFCSFSFFVWVLYVLTMCFFSFSFVFSSMNVHPFSLPVCMCS